MKRQEQAAAAKLQVDELRVQVQQDKAATKLQAVQRGRAARKEVAILRYRRKQELLAQQVPHVCYNYVRVRLKIIRNSETMHD